MDLKRAAMKKTNEHKTLGCFISNAEFAVDSLLHGGAFLGLALVVESHLGFHPSVNGNTLKTRREQMKCFKRTSEFNLMYTQYTWLIYYSLYINYNTHSTMVK